MFFICSVQPPSFIRNASARRTIGILSKAKVYLYYKCLSKINGIKKECPVGAVSARKVEEYLIEKLAAVGYDRPLLERVVAKVKEITSAQLGPLEEEKRDVAEGEGFEPSVGVYTPTTV